LERESRFNARCILSAREARLSQSVAYHSALIPGTSPQKFTRFESAASTTRFEPIVNEEAGLAKNIAAFSISGGIAVRPAELRARLFVSLGHVLLDRVPDTTLK
jgi:hypothetical protein